VTHTGWAQTIESHGDFVAALHHSVALAGQHSARRMVWADTDFANWPLDDAALLQRLVDWLRLPQRQLLLLAADYEDLRRRHARFTAMYGLWSHAIVARAPAQDEAAPLPCLVLAGGTAAVHLMDTEHWRGWISADPGVLRRWQERADALLQRSEVAFPVTTLGL